ncbi:hypothetical protein AXX12_09665 [Anaerosporomusa subterranea]|uniref:Uncharacterized protein n=1 Tax=Anaerosporomusa subterranea TaxID=1794912 RepID=A0A154BRU7_ANASB|nr:hypothetical protein [Anaerosporomusa subterranea]KYZ76676.1 hypothetical protein AXX12_09665 [Anaerosporomusa subterranea]
MSVETLDRFKWYILVFALGGFIGGVGVVLFAPVRVQNHFSERIIEREVPAVQETIKQTSQTEIAYVPKAIISAEQVNPTTEESKMVVSKEKTDVEVRVEKPAVSVKVNGQPYSFALLAGEIQKFDRGKISLQQDSKIGIELAVKPQIIDRTKSGGLDIFVGRYSGIGVYHRRIGLDIGTDGRNQDYRLRWRAMEW